jgi:hypothetical protein
MSSGTGSLADGNIAKGAYQTLREPMVNSVSRVTQPLTSHAENISGSVTELFEPVTTFVDELKQKIADATAAPEVGALGGFVSSIELKNDLSTMPIRLMQVDTMGNDPAHVRLPRTLLALESLTYRGCCKSTLINNPVESCQPVLTG